MTSIFLLRKRQHYAAFFIVQKKLKFALNYFHLFNKIEYHLIIKKKWPLLNFLLWQN